MKAGMSVSNGNRRLLLSSILLIAWLFSGCSDQGENVVAPSTNTIPEVVTWTDHIYPLIQVRCLQCHGVDAGFGNFVITGYDSIMAKISSQGTRMVWPERPDSSEILFRLQAINGRTIMPQTGALSPYGVDLIRAWIEGGALENEDGS